jgi:hypothetical protein
MNGIITASENRYTGYTRATRPMAVEKVAAVPAGGGVGPREHELERTKNVVTAWYPRE